MATTRTTGVRRARPGDGAAIEAVRVAGWRSAYAGLVPAAYLDAMDPVSGGDRWDGWLAGDDDPSTVLVHESAGGVVDGFISVGPDRDEPDSGASELWALYVAPDAWGAGAADALVDAGLAALPEGPVVLNVFRDNARARRFYERRGFRFDAVVADWAVPGSDVGVPEVRLRLDR